MTPLIHVTIHLVDARVVRGNVNPDHLAEALECSDFWLIVEDVASAFGAARTLNVNPAHILWWERAVPA